MTRYRQLAFLIPPTPNPVLTISDSTSKPFLLQPGGAVELVFPRGEL